jgi:transposase
MTWRPQPLPPVPEATAAAVRAAFPKGNLYVDLRTEFCTLYDDHLFADLYADHGRPVDVAPWRLALVMVMQDYRRAHRSSGGGCRPPLYRLEICPQP